MSTQPSLALRQNIESLAEKIVDLLYAQQPEYWLKHAAAGRVKSVRDAGYHLTYLAEALDANDHRLFSQYLAWVKVLFANLQFSERVLPETIQCTRQVILQNLPEEVSVPILQILDTSIQELQFVPIILPEFINDQEPFGRLARQYLDYMLNGDRRAASTLVIDSVKNGVAVKDIYRHVFQPCQRELGRLWQTNHISVAQEHYCTAVTQLVMSQLYPSIFSGQRVDRRIVMACVGGELHEIGARMVADFFEMEGWDTYYLGANNTPDSVVRIVEERRADVLALSATMTFHISKVTEIINLLRSHPRVSRTIVLVGGYPFNISPGLWQHIGADGYAVDADTAVAEVQKLLPA